MQLFKNETHFNFMGRIKAAVIFSIVLILIGLGSVAVSGGLKFGIDFAGGTLIQLQFKSPPDIEVIRDGLKTIGLGESTIQEFGSKRDILIRVQRSEEKLEAVGSMVRKSLMGKFNVDEISVERVEMVGPKVGRDLREKALLSILYAIIGIVIYISWRFEVQYAIAAIIALIHDVLVTMGAFSIFDKEFTLVIVAAFLTIIGYSLNDTIVVFDRIRENMGMRRKDSYEAVVNRSINETLSRTIITSLTTLMVAVILFIFGGPVIHEFAFALTVGVLVGTYSSIFVASPVVIAWYRWRSGERNLRGKAATASG
jgi:preprotein translocase subunit SecF